MREIKFRAWDKNREVYIFDGMDYAMAVIKIDFCETEYKHCIGYSQKEWEYFDIEQFTGLLDKNGREIYEGDILHCIPEDYVGKVWFSSAAFMTDASGFGDIALSEINSDEYCEVIGNIHENPWLLEGSAK